MASAVAMMISRCSCECIGVLWCSNYLFSHMGKSGDAEKERERHDKALEQLEEAQAMHGAKKEQKDWIL